MQDQLIAYATAALAKAKGFKERAMFGYGQSGELTMHRPHRRNESMADNYCSAPTQGLLGRWLRETHHLHVNVQHNMHYAWQVQLQDIRGYDGTERLPFDEKWLANDYATYETAMEAGLAHALAQLN